MAKNIKIVKKKIDFSEVKPILSHILYVESKNWFVVSSLNIPIFDTSFFKIMKIEFDSTCKDFVNNKIHNFLEKNPS
jgi:hypothetical protein